MQACWKSFLSLGKAEFEKDSFIIIIIIIIIIVNVIVIVIVIIIIIGLILKWSENVCLGTHWLSLAIMTFHGLKIHDRIFFTMW